MGERASRAKQLGQSRPAIDGWRTSLGRAHERNDLLGEALHLCLERLELPHEELDALRVESTDPLGDALVGSDQPRRRATVRPDVGILAVAVGPGARSGAGLAEARREAASKLEAVLAFTREHARSRRAPTTSRGSASRRRSPSS